MGMQAFKKNDTAVAQPRAKKPKSQAAQAKKAANMKAAEERLARLQQKQRLVNAYRARGVIGSDAVVLRIAEQEERRQEEVRCRQFVERAMFSYGERISRSLSLKGHPCQVAQRIREFMKLNSMSLDAVESNTPASA
jgi:tRNA A37 methylthiotransferase MiaB